MIYTARAAPVVAVAMKLELVMLAMICDPVDDPALDSEASGQREEGAHLGSDLECVVGEEAVVADGDPMDTDRVDGNEHDEV